MSHVKSFARFMLLLGLLWLSYFLLGSLTDLPWVASVLLAVALATVVLVGSSLLRSGGEGAEAPTPAREIWLLIGCLLAEVVVRLVAPAAQLCMRALVWALFLMLWDVAGRRLIAR